MKRPSIEMLIGARLRRRRATLAVAESCTGGLLGARITSAAGSSDYFLGGCIAYSNAVKIRQLGVDRRTLAREGAVSEPVARQMAAGARRCFGADYGVGITGVAGPGGGTEEKPVGLVFIGVAGPAGGTVRSAVLRGDRARVRRQSVDMALRMLSDALTASGNTA